METEFLDFNNGIAYVVFKEILDMYSSLTVFKSV